MEQGRTPSSRHVRVEWAARVAAPELGNASDLPKAAEAFEHMINGKLAEFSMSNFNLTGAHTVGPMLVMLGQRLTPTVNVPVPSPSPETTPAAIMYLYLDGESVRSREFDSIVEAKKQVTEDLKNGLKPFSMHLTSVQSFTEEQIAELVKG